jgi:hypothetical protein
VRGQIVEDDDISPTETWHEPAWTHSTNRVVVIAPQALLIASHRSQVDPQLE